MLDVLQISRKIIQTYVYRFFPEGSYAPYERVQSEVQKAGISNKIRKRMLYLLRKASDCHYLNRAVCEMEYEFSISSYKTDKVLQCFENLNYNPVTTLGETLPGIRELLGFTDGIDLEDRSKFDVHSVGSQTETAEAENADCDGKVINICSPTR